MTWVARKLARALVVLLVVGLGVTFMLDLGPGDPAYAILGDQATPDQVAQVHRELHLDDPVLERYGDWIADVARFDFGESYITHERVTDAIVAGLPVTAELIGLAPSRQSLMPLYLAGL